MTDRQLSVFLDGTFVGTAEQNMSGAYCFRYDDEYRSGTRPTPLSLSMPLVQQEHRGRSVHFFLDGLLPDSESARRRWGTQYGVNPGNPFALLRNVGRDAAGAVQILPAGAESTDAAARNGDIEWLSDDEVADIVVDLASHRDDWDPGRSRGLWSLAGAQPKIALHRNEEGRWGIPRDSTPTTHIIKPAIAEFDAHEINETLCIRTASNLGLRASKIEVLELPGARAVVSERYDRVRQEGRWVRRHQEDLCQALAVSPKQKYQTDKGPGVADVARIAHQLPHVEDRRDVGVGFFKGLAFNVLTGSPDAHAKNYSLLLSRDRVILAPLYDIASAAPYVSEERFTSAMSVNKKWRMLDITIEDWEQAGARLGLQRGEAEDMVKQMREGMDSALSQAVDSMPDDARDSAASMAEAISEHTHGRWRPAARSRSGHRSGDLAH
ncbi:MAG: type II toxin-antitoxin system HipA family toxin [Actinomycetia bacterium]|nr:type II toxin-antitoxin system HipA family toxin [Actinomycetes bacterium]